MSRSGLPLAVSSTDPDLISNCELNRPGPNGLYIEILCYKVVE